jgi:plasmid stability protein
MISKYVDEELDLSDEVLEQLKELATQHNATVDEVVRDILTEAIAKNMRDTEFADWVTAWTKGDADESPFTKYVYIRDSNGNLIAKVIPVDSQKWAEAQ